jgi:peroxiredoxin Q/BCP
MAGNGRPDRRLNMAEQGDTAPNVTFATPDGTRTIAGYQGRKLVLYFYPKDDTSGCTKEAQEFTALADDFAKAGTDIVGISKDSIASHTKFATKYGLKVELGSDADGAVCDAFGTWVEKSMYGRQYMGIERATFLIGADGKIARVWRKVKVAGHAAEVLKAAKAL